MQKIQGFVEVGNTTLVVSGATGTIARKVQGSFPSATVTVYLSGSITLASIYSDNSLTTKANPFVSGSDGMWFFYAANGRYDIKLSGGGITTPFTLGDFELFDIPWIDVTASPYNADKSGVVNSTAAFQSAGTAAIAAKLPLYIPGGTYIVRGKTTLSGATVFGDGMGVSIIQADASIVSNLGVFGINGDNVKFRDLTFSLNKGSSTISAVQIDAASTNLIFDSVEFIGTGPNDDCYGINVHANNLTDLRVVNSKFNGISYVIIKTNSDISVTKNTIFDNVTVVNTASGINVNHPSSTGSWTDITVTNSYFDTMNASGAPTHSWGVGFSGIGVKRATVSNCTFINSIEQGIDMEDQASEISIIGNRFFKKGATIAGQGLVNGINLVHAIEIIGNTFDMTDIEGALVAGVGVNLMAGGGAGAPYDVIISCNTFLTKASMTAIVAAECTNVAITGNLFSNPDSASKATAFINITGSRCMTGNGNTFYNPAALVQIDGNSGYGVLHNSTIDGSLTSFSFLTGNSASRTSIVFDGFTITRSFEVGNPSAANTLFPAGSTFNGIVGLRYNRGGTVSSFVATFKMSWDGVAPTVMDLVNVSGGDTGGLTSITVSGGNVTAIGVRTLGTLSDGFSIITFSGPYIA